MSNKSDLPFDLEFLNHTNLQDTELYQIAYDEIIGVTEGHKDIVGASISIDELSSGTTPHAYQARVVLYARPDHISATDVKPSAMEALKQALNAAIKQIREKRDRLRNY